MTSLLSSFSFLGIREWHPNDGMRRNEGDFGSGQKNWILRCLSFCHHSVIWSSFRNVLITFNLSVKSGPQSPSAEGDWGPDFTLNLEMKEGIICGSSLHPWLIPSFLIHSFRSKREVWPPITLCRGWLGARVLASPWYDHWHHPWLIPSFLIHSFRLKRQVWPPITLCRGWWGARLLKNASLLATDPLDLNVLNNGMTPERWDDKGMIIPPSFCHWMI